MQVNRNKTRIAYLDFASIDGGLLLGNVQNEELGALGDSFSRCRHFVLVTIVRVLNNGVQSAAPRALIGGNTYEVTIKLNDIWYKVL